MSNVEKISVALTHDVLTRVREAVASGRYASSSEVVREALRDWTRRHDQEVGSADELRRLIAEGLASGSRPLELIEVLREEGRRRLAELQAGKQ